jgi:hypothetical protein
MLPAALGPSLIRLARFLLDIHTYSTIMLPRLRNGSIVVN